MPRNTKKIPQNPSSPHPFYPDPRYTHQTDQTLQAHFIDELPKTWGLRMPTQICLNPESTREKIQFQEPQMDFGLLRSWFASSTLSILLPNEPLPKNNLQKTFPRFNFNPSKPSGSFVLTIFHVCRPHLHSCLGSWHLPTRKRHISYLPFFSWWFTNWGGEIFHWSSKVLQVTRRSEFGDPEISYLICMSTTKQMETNLPAKRTSWKPDQIQAVWPFGPIPIDPYMKQLLRNVKLKNSLIVSLQSTIQQQLQ